MAKEELAEYNGKKGIWRTVSGRRIFIAEGESLRDAMKKSGKFHKLEGTKAMVDNGYEKRLAKYKEIQKDANKRYDKGEIDRAERNKLIDDAHDKYIKGKTTKMSVDKMEKTANDIVDHAKGTKDELTKKARDTIIAGYDDYTETVNQFAVDNGIGLAEAKQYFEDAGKKLGLKKSRLTGEDDRNARFIKTANRIHNKTLAKTKEIEKSYDEDKRYNTNNDIGYDPRKEAKYYLEKGEFNKFDEHTKEYGLEEERNLFLEGVNSKVARDYEDYKRIEKYMEIPEKERVQAYVEGKNWKELTKRKENDEKVKIRAKQQMDQLHKMQEESGEWKNEGWGIYTRKTEEGTNYISSGRKANGSVDYVRTDYDKEGNELSSKTYKSLEKAQSVKQRATIQSDAKILKQLETNNKATEYGDGYSSVDLKDGYKINKYKDGKIQISKPHPYDETEYSWARKTNNGYEIIESGKIVGKTKTINQTIKAIKERDKNKKRTGGIW